MLLLRLWNYLRGYVIINVKGYFVEKFINLCANKGIYLWDIKRKLPHSMILKISAKGFKELRGVAKKTRCKIKIVRKIGIPFIKYRYRRRKSFIAGFVIFFAVIYVLSSFIWVIEINGADKTPVQSIINFLDQRGIKPGIIKYRFDKDRIIADMMISIDTLAWVDIRQEGTKVIVDVRERIPKPEIVDRSTPCNIYSNNNGVIKNIITKNGIAMVRAGDVVRKGQQLVSGIVENKFNPMEVRYVHSDSIIKAYTWYEDVSEVNFVQNKRERTGEFMAGYSFKVFSDYYSIFREKSPYADGDIEEKSMRLAFWKNYELPIEFVVKKYYKVQNKKYNLTENAAKELAKDQAFKKAETLVPQGTQESDRKIEYEVINDNKTIRARASIQVIEDIGYKEPIAKE